MRAIISACVLAAVLLTTVACASPSDDRHTTTVNGGIVSEGDQDWDREFSDEEVTAFAAAYVEVSNIQQNYQTQIAGAEGEERERLSDESSERAEEAMMSHGVTPQEYNTVVSRLPDDEELRERVGAAVQELESERIRETQRELDSE